MPLAALTSASRHLRLSVAGLRALSTRQDYVNRRKVVTRGEESENVMRMWFEWMHKHRDQKKAITDEKRMFDSYFTQELPFSSDRILRDEYINYFGDIRIAKLLENLDALAGRIAYEHCYNEEFIQKPKTVVTAAVDKILLIKRISIDRDIRLNGHVSWVGNSSMEVSLSVEARDEKNAWENMLITNFVMVARDPTTGKAAPVNRLKIETEEEKRIFERGQRLHEVRLKLSKDSLERTPPTAEELKVIHELLTQKPQNGVINVKDTVLQWSKICHPQERNIHNKIFGGYLMREAFDLAFACGMVFCKSRPLFVSQDNIQFRRPVEIGSILNLKAKVVRCQGHPHKTFQISVVATVVEPQTGTSQVTNVFHFIFYSDTQLPTIYPETYLESMEYLEAARRKKTSIGFEETTMNQKWLIDPEVVQTLGVEQ